MLDAKNLDIGYDLAAPVFSKIAFTLSNGDMVALLGENGIGKSTLLRTMAGLQAQLTGTLEIGGKDIYAMPASQRAKLISIVFTERLPIDHINVRDFIALGRAPYTAWLGTESESDRAIVERVIAQVNIEKLKFKLFNRISDGEKQKVLIARALCQQTSVLLLDEPTAFLDFRNKKDVLALLNGISQKMNNIVVISTHDIEAALEYCNKFWIMNTEGQFMQIGKAGNYRDKVKAILYGKELNG
jgi:iron complex transport system ATP-binding protein